MKNIWLTILLSVGMSLGAVTAQANIDLKSWKSYGNLAEQGAICASFASLMESQSVLNPDMGRLWQERRKFSGAVIGKAVMMEFDKDIASEDIETFIAEYRDWVLAALMTSPESQPDNQVQNSLKLGQEKVASLIKTQCALLFKQGDAQIRKKFPELAYLIASEPRAVADNPNAQNKAEIATLAGPRKTTPPAQDGPFSASTNPVKAVSSAPDKIDDAPAKLAKTETKPKISAPENSDGNSAKTSDTETQQPANDAPVTLALGGGVSFSVTMPRSSASAETPKSAETSDSAPVQAPAQAQTQAQTQAQAPKSPESRQASIVNSLPVAPPERPSFKVARPAPVSSAQNEQTAQVAQAGSQKTVPAAPTRPASDMVASDMPTKQKPVPAANTPPTAPPVLTLAQQQATPLILPVSLILPALPDNETKIAKIYASFGDFTDIAQAEQRKALLESRFAKLFSAYQLQITAHDLPTIVGQSDSTDTQRAAPAYRLQTKATLAITRAQEICTLLWPHDVGCIVKAHYNS
ncbi:MAG: hypothetical protein ACPG7D_05500 [Candidatus Puniceispirillaceae bacterium]